METGGMLHIFIYTTFKNIDGRRMNKRVTMFKGECIGFIQAKGILADIKGMNPAIAGKLSSIWQPHAVHFV